MGNSPGRKMVEGHCRLHPHGTEAGKHVCRILSKVMAPPGLSHRGGAGWGGGRRDPRDQRKNLRTGPRWIQSSSQCVFIADVIKWTNFRAVSNTMNAYMMIAKDMEHHLPDLKWKQTVALLRLQLCA